MLVFSAPRGRPCARPRGRRALLALTLAAVACQGPPERPNVVLITIDTTRADHCSVYGYERRTTPTLEALAAAGTRFDAAYAPAATTGPSHASLFTGLYPIGHGAVENNVPLPASHVTLTERFAAAGYDTAAVVSSFVLDPRFGHAQGFAHYDAAFTRETSTFRRRRWGGHQITDGFDRRADATTDRALAWLDVQRAHDKPFFLFVHYFDPHDPYVPPAAFARRFGGPLRSRPDDVRRRYDSEIAFVDEQIGRLLGALDEAKLAPTTIVVVTADHGEGLWTHKVLGHAFHVYEEAVRVPLIVRWPGRVRTQIVTRPVTLVDVAPTIADLAGLATAPGEWQGRNLAPVLRDGAVPPAGRPIVSHRGERVDPRSRGHDHGVRLGRWKYIETVTPRGELLFDLARDPGERRNVAKRHPHVVRRAREELRRWRRVNARRHETRPDLSEETRAKLEALGYAQ